MKCEEIESRMIDYLEGTLDQKKMIEIEKHLETCGRCLDDLRECQEMIKLTGGLPMEQPGEGIRINFYSMLDSEMAKPVSAMKSPSGKQSLLLNKPFLAAAGVALLVCGAFIGMLINPGRVESSDTAELEKLQSRMTELQKSIILTRLSEESSVSRLEGLMYAEQMSQPDDKIIEALLSTMNRDDNVNVRLAAIYSLSKFTAERTVCDSLVASLPRQNDPIIQITLINILASIKETAALRSIQKIIDNKNTLLEVKSAAEKGAAEIML